MASGEHMSGFQEDLARRRAARGGSDRSFGVTFAVLLAGIAVWPLWRGGGVRPWALLPAGILLFAAMAAPRWLRRLNVLWTRLGTLLARITTPVFAAVLFYFVFTPAALVLRAAGWDPLGRRFDPRARSYWIPRVPPSPDPARMREQY